MAKRSYLDSSPNYQKAKKGMLPFKHGGPEPDEVMAKHRSLLNSLLESPSLENAHRAWTKPDPRRNGDAPYESAGPNNTFDDFVRRKEARNAPNTWSQPPAMKDLEYLPQELKQELGLMTKTSKGKKYYERDANKDEKRVSHPVVAKRAKAVAAIKAKIEEQKSAKPLTVQLIKKPKDNF
jgi:hypothetical protein